MKTQIAFLLYTPQAQDANSIVARPDAPPMELTSCKEESADPVNQLLPATTTGKNTFGGLVNGDVVHLLMPVLGLWPQHFLLALR